MELIQRVAEAANQGLCAPKIEDKSTLVVKIISHHILFLCIEQYDSINVILRKLLGSNY